MLQAVVYFQRALKQDRRFLNAWTLMGHEYVEMKNPPAAIGGPVATLKGFGTASKKPPRGIQGLQLPFILSKQKPQALL